MGNDWWDLNSMYKSLLQTDHLCLQYIKEVLQEKDFVKQGTGFQLSDQLTILDAGCGGGILTEPLARAGAKVLGIDISKSAIESAETHAQLDPCLKNLSYRCESIEEHSLNNIEKYDVVILNFVLHLVSNKEAIIQCCLKTLKPGGLIFLSSAAKTYKSWFKLALLGQYVIRYVPWGHFDWNKFINSTDVERMLKQSGCSLEGDGGICRNQLSGCFEWQESKDELYIMHATKQ